MTRPTRQTAAGRVYLDLQNQARKEKRPTQEVFTLYALERWLARLAASPHNRSFILKGGLLLAAFDTRRATSDGDLLARRLANDTDTVSARIVEIAQVRLLEDDGVEFLTDTVDARTIREGADYTGVRVTMFCHIAKARIKLSLDVNIGDPVTPAPSLVDLPSQLPDRPPVRILGYSLETVLAEKISTAIALGAGNTRVRDYADIHALTARHPVSFDTMRAALSATAEHRGVKIRPLSTVIGEFTQLQKANYDAFRRRQGAAPHLPATLAEVVTAVVAFADPLAEPSTQATAWSSEDHKWR